ncbi:MAG: RluA family pseudouridine synthase [Deltaproteobacteria bacterium]|nr:RluA family pseudouridine synthase [Deltaproteobacteria bacterium]
MAQHFQYQVPASNDGERLDRFLASTSPNLSRSQLKRLIDQGHVQVDQAPAKPGHKLKQGQLVSLVVPDVSPSHLIPEPEISFEILYQDQAVIIVNKPAGLVVHPAAGHQKGTLVQGLLAFCQDLTGIGGELRPGIVHRLDKDTSGVMVVAKTDKAHQSLVTQFKEGRTEKFYLALCRGWPKSDQGQIDAPIGRHPVRRKQMSTRSHSGRKALTRFDVLRRFGQGISLLRLNILTGRTHQIRVHLASIGCPILGDRLYGVGLGWLKKSGGPLKGLVARQMLHAERLSFFHPETGRKMTFKADVPEDISRVLEALERDETGRPSQ